MPNKNYLKGRALEYEVVKMYKQAGGQATRTAGSHGWCDVVALLDGRERELDWGTFERLPLGICPVVYQRVRTKHVDTLYLWTFHGVNSDTVHLIQCKRRLANAGKGSTKNPHHRPAVPRI